MDSADLIDVIEFINIRDRLRREKAEQIRDRICKEEIEQDKLLEQFKPKTSSPRPIPRACSSPKPMYKSQNGCEPQNISDSDLE